MSTKMVYWFSLVLMAAHAGYAGEVARWDFDETSGTTATDQSGLYVATLTGSDTLDVDGKFGSGVDLAGDGGMTVDAASSEAFRFPGDFTIVLWINPDVAVGDYIRFVDISAADGGLADSYRLMTGNGASADNFRFMSEQQDGSNTSDIHTRDLAVETWSLLVVRHDLDGDVTMNVLQDGDVVDAAFVGANSESWPTAGGIVYAAGELKFGRLIGTGRKFDGKLDGIAFYDEVLTDAAIATVFNSAPVSDPIAVSPKPGDAAVDVPRDVVLNWDPGAFAQTHSVYLGTVYEDVNNASPANPLDVLVSQNQQANAYDAGALDFGQTYYWRIDEVNAPPDETVFKGAIWSFEVEPVSYPVPLGAVKATASSMTDPQDPNNTVNESGLDPNTGEHSNLIQDMWICAMDDAEPSIQFEFENLQKLDKVLVWNHNSQSEALLGFGTKEALITYSADGETWSELGTVEIAQAPGMGSYTGVEVPLEGIVAKVVRLACLSNWSALPSITQKGLSEVRFFAVPVYAREPQPEDGATADGADITLQWRAGREAVSHDVLLSSDPNAVEDGSAVVGSTEEPEFQTGPLSYDTTYFWQIVEVNEAATPAAYPGDIWQFTAPPVGVIDDMERYKASEGLRIWEHWIDGFDNPDENGAVVGNGDNAERTIVYNGSQSLPMAYNNNSAPTSEATRTFETPLDLTASDVQGLVLHFHGSATNVGGRLYVKINDAQVPYDSDADNLQRAGWSKWFIPLADVTGTDLTQVTSLTIGVDSGGQGIVYVDDIVVTPEARARVAPVDPGTDGLVSHYAFEGDAADSTGQHPGTVMGFGRFEPGAVGQAISLNGFGDNYVEITDYKGIVADADGIQQAFSVACWFNTEEDGDMVTWGSADGTPDGGQYMTFRIEAGNLRAEHGDGNLRGNTTCNDGEWHHGALTVVEGANLRVPQTMLYIDGQADGVNSGSDNVYNVTADADLNIGQRASHLDRWFTGLLDEVMIYDRVLSAGEVAALAGRTLPFDQP